MSGLPNTNRSGARFYISLETERYERREAKLLYLLVLVRKKESRSEIQKVADRRKSSFTCSSSEN